MEQLELTGKASNKENKAITNAKKQYYELFPDEKTKAEAFDKIAEEFYFCNFGSMQKSDFETLLFSIYIDRILGNSESEPWTYSDYTLSKFLGITQTKVSNLKVKKELKYPYANFEWKESFRRLTEHARYEDGKIKIYIPDKNLYLEIKNAVEISGGYVEMQLNQQLLQIRPEFFIDLVLSISEDEDRKKLREKIKRKLKEKDMDIEFFDNLTIGENLRKGILEGGTEVAIEILAFCGNTVGSPLGDIIKNVLSAIKRNVLK